MKMALLGRIVNCVRRWFTWGRKSGNTEEERAPLMGGMRVPVRREESLSEEDHNAFTTTPLIGTPLHSLWERTKLSAPRSTEDSPVLAATAEDINTISPGPQNCSATLGEVAYLLASKRRRKPFTSRATIQAYSTRPNSVGLWGLWGLWCPWLGLKGRNRQQGGALDERDWETPDGGAIMMPKWFSTGTPRQRAEAGEESTHRE